MKLSPPTRQIWENHCQWGARAVKFKCFCDPVILFYSNRQLTTNRHNVFSFFSKRSSAEEADAMHIINFKYFSVYIYWRSFFIFNKLLISLVLSILFQKTVNCLRLSISHGKIHVEWWTPLMMQTNTIELLNFRLLPHMLYFLRFWKPTMIHNNKKKRCVFF